MDYENRPIPEGINVSDEHPLVDFIWMLVTVALVVAVLIAALAFSAGWLARKVPFSQELRWAETFAPRGTDDSGESTQCTQAWLQQLSVDLADKMSLPAEMKIQVHYVDNDDVVNAYATIGGNVVMFSGLLNALESENAVAMVLAHEIAHIQHRDPIVALGRGAAVILGISALGGLSDSAMAQQVIGNVGLMTQLSFSRGQEHDADEAAIKALLAYYGHLEGAASLFEYLERQSPTRIPEMLATHPLTEKRIERIKHAAAAPAGQVQAIKNCGED